MTERKSFGLALLIWFFLGGIGGHRIYIQEKVSVILWYWLVTIVTLGIFPIVDAFRLKTLIIQAHAYDKAAVSYEQLK